jgi:hypothetical protein
MHYAGTGLDLEVERNARVAGGLDAGQSQNEGRGPIAGYLGIGIEQINFGMTGARRRNCEASFGLQSQMRQNMRGAEGRDTDSRASPALAAASVCVLHSPDTMRSIAARTFFESA